MKVLQAISKYLIIFLTGIGLAFFVARIQYDTTDLSASVLSLTEKEFFESNNRDAGYKKENQTFELFLSEDVRNDGILTVSILFSPHDFERKLDELTTEYIVTIADQNNSNLVLNIDGYKNGNFDEGIFQLPFNGDYENVTLEYVNSSEREFAIGNLDNIENLDH